MIIPNLPWREVINIAKQCQFIRLKPLLILCIYYAVAVLSALLEGVGLVLLVELVTGRVDLNRTSLLLEYVTNFFRLFSVPIGYSSLFLFVILLIAVRVVLVFLSFFLDGYLEANIRRRIQERGFVHILKGDWEFLRTIRVGQRIGAVSEESSKVATLFMSAIKATYYLLAAAVLTAIAVMVSPATSALFIAVGIPALLLLKYFFDLQAKAVKAMVMERQSFFTDITECLNGLFQIKVEGNFKYFQNHGLRSQAKLTGFEIRYGYLRAIINGLTVLLPALIFLVFYLWVSWRGESLQANLYILAGIGVVGARALSQISSAIASIGNLTSFSGSVLPVNGLFSIPPEIAKKPVNEEILGVRLKNVSYRYSEKTGVHNLIMEAEVGRPLIIMGPSGAGKTTVANLVAGLYRPNEGEVWYVGVSGREYNALEFKPKVGYVTQDIHLLHGTIRENLLAGQNMDDDFLWKYLKQVGAEDYVSKMGGLDAVIAEAGRSLSGGEKRRLGIARVLTKKPQVLILDEITAGLDEERKKEVIRTIADLSKEMVLVVITHDPVQLEGANLYNFEGKNRQVKVHE